MGSALGAPCLSITGWRQEVGREAEADLVQNGVRLSSGSREPEGEVRQQVWAEGLGGSPRRGRQQAVQCENRSEAAGLKVAGPIPLLLEPAGV